MRKKNNDVKRLNGSRYCFLTAFVALALCPLGLLVGCGGEGSASVSLPAGVECTRISSSPCYFRVGSDGQTLMMYRTDMLSYNEYRIEGDRLVVQGPGEGAGNVVGRITLKRDNTFVIDKCGSSFLRSTIGGKWRIKD